MPCQKVVGHESYVKLLYMNLVGGYDQNTSSFRLLTKLGMKGSKLWHTKLQQCGTGTLEFLEGMEVWRKVRQS